MKSISEQVVVVIGASKGIGRATCLRLGKKGAKIVCASRSENGLRSLVQQIGADGGEATYVLCDVAKMEDIKKVADTALAKYGRIDTWVHTPAILEIGPLETITEDEMKRIFDVNSIGALRSMQIAMSHMKTNPGAIVMITSGETRRTLAWHGAYGASKKAMEGFIEAARTELLREKSPLSLTSIIPATMNTPFFDQARIKHGDKKLIGPPPLYHPDVVASSIEYAATHPVRILHSGSFAWAIDILQSISPTVVDWMSLLSMATYSTHMPKPEKDNFYEPLDQQDLNQTTGKLGKATVPFSMYNMVRENILMGVVDSMKWTASQMVTGAVSCVM